MTECTVQIDLTPFGGSRAELHGELDFNEFELPVRLRIYTSSVKINFGKFFSADQQPKPHNLPVTCKLLDGEVLSGLIEVPSGLVCDGPITHIERKGQDFIGLRIHKCVRRTSAENHSPPATWAFNLTNALFYSYDKGTDSNNVIVDEIRFTASGHEWLIQNLLAEQGKKKSDLDDYHPVVTTRLSTPYRDDDDFATLQPLVREIELLLSFALSKGVRTTLCKLQDTSGKAIETHLLDMLLYPLRDGGFAPVDNWKRGTLKKFLETAHPIMVKDRRWWELTLDLFLQARLSRYIDIACIPCNVLMNRIANKHRADNTSAEIDPDLPAKIKNEQFKNDLHELLSQLSQNWTPDRTETILGRINEINSRPPFGESIGRVCDKFELSKPSKKLLKLLGKRNKLLHNGEIEGNEADILAYWDEIDWLVTALLLRMLGYDGRVYHRKFGSQTVELAKVTGGPIQPSTPNKQ